tara:strand:- start:16093 stop:16305 length:213 start_codon:yes stop_codon:yes gene_type:complete
MIAELNWCHGGMQGHCPGPVAVPRYRAPTLTTRWRSFSGTSRPGLGSGDEDEDEDEYGAAGDDEQVDEAG